MIEIRMPEDESEGTEASLGKWLKKPGDAVSEHEPLIEINTDKVTVEIPAPASGMLAELLKTEGDAVNPGDLLGRIQTETEAGVAKAATSEGKNMPSVAAVSKPAPGATSNDSQSPAVRRMLKEHNLESTLIPRVGHGRRLTIEDVEAYLANREGEAKPTSGKSESSLVGRRVPHTPMRKSIANHMARSVLAAPHVTSVFEADLSQVLADRARRKQASKDAEIPSVTAYLLRAAVQAIQKVPEVNSKWHDDYLEVFDEVNFGVGTALDLGGLVVPVIRNAQALDLMEISQALRAMTQKARSGKLTHADMQDGTFTLSNHGVSGSLMAAPIILPHGQAAILGAGKMQKRVVVCETGGRELFRVSQMMYVTLTVDHRVLDGQQTNAFLTEFVSALEKPA
jgi:2-oxoglutarate dehydrogenase E2 component (dihydrolipoamide succinyltransferase)